MHNKKKDRSYLFRVKKERAPLTRQSFNDIYGHLSADELLMKYNAHFPKPMKEESERLNRMFRKFD